MDKAFTANCRFFFEYLFNIESLSRGDQSQVVKEKYRSVSVNEVYLSVTFTQIKQASTPPTQTAPTILRCPGCIAGRIRRPTNPESATDPLNFDLPKPTDCQTLFHSDTSCPHHHTLHPHHNTHPTQHQRLPITRPATATGVLILVVDPNRSRPVQMMGLRPNIGISLLSPAEVEQRRAGLKKLDKVNELWDPGSGELVAIRTIIFCSPLTCLNLLSSDWVYVDESGQEVPAAQAEIHSSLTVGEYYRICSFKIGHWNGEAVKILTKLGDPESAQQVFGEIERGVLRPTRSIKSLKYEAEARFGKDALTVKVWESGLPACKSMSKHLLP